MVTGKSTAPDIATVSNDGIIIGVDGGEARFIYTEGVSGCISDTSLLCQYSAETRRCFRRTFRGLCGESNSTVTRPLVESGPH